MVYPSAPALPPEIVLTRDTAIPLLKPQGGCNMTCTVCHPGGFVEAAPNARLDTQETPQQTDYWDRFHSLEDDLTEATAFIHSGWHAFRQRIYNAMRELDVPLGVRQAYRNCGTNAWVHEATDEPGLYKIVASYCHNRWCRICGNLRGRVIAANILEATLDKELRFLTLTLKVQPRHPDDHDDPASLAFRLDHLTKSFTRLRRSPDWTRYVSGGAAFIEIKWSTSASGWNVHLHVICTGAYYPHKRLSDAWLKASGDSWIVDIRSVASNDKVVGYVCKYASKPLSGSVVRRHDLLMEAIPAMRSKRTIVTFGTWTHYKLTKRHTDHEWKAVDSLDAILERALAGDRHAQVIILKLQPQTDLPTPTYDSRDPPNTPTPVKQTQARMF